MNVVIGETAIRISTSDPAFERVLRAQYAGFIEPEAREPIELAIDLTPPTELDPDADICVRHRGAAWTIQRGDFDASFEPESRRAVVRQSVSRQSIDSAIRVIHSLTLVDRGGFLLHAASAIRDGRAFIFTGPSGAGKTTISSLAPSDVCLLTDEVSCLRNIGGRWQAFGTPFAGELARPGENRAAPVEAVYLLRHGPENRVSATGTAAAARSLLRNVLFFADDPVLTARVFDTICDFVGRVKVFELTFVPDASVWEFLARAVQ